MARPRKMLALDPFEDLDRKTAVLERELLTQRAAIERLKEMATRSHHARRTHDHPRGVRSER